MSLAVETGGQTQVGSQRSSEPILPRLPLRPDGPFAPLGSAPRPGATIPPAPVETIIHRHSLLQAFQSLLYIIIIALFIITFTVQPFRIPSESMEPTLLVGDFLLVNKQASSDSSSAFLAPASFIHRGDLIVFHYPVDPSMHLVKRVVGLPGDHLRLRDGRVYIDGHAISEPYAVFRSPGTDSYRDEFPHLVSADPGVDSRWWIQMHSLVSQGELTVPRDSYFVLGDNRDDSEDSRYWGFVPRAAIVGKPFLIYFSLNNPGLTPGQSSAAAMPGDETVRRAGAANSLVDFARWNRALRIIH